MLQPVLDNANGILVVRPGAEMFTAIVVIRPSAPKLRAAYNSKYSAAFDPKAPARAHQVAEDYVVAVQTAVFEQRAAKWVDERTAHEFDEESGACLMGECTGICVQAPKPEPKPAPRKRSRAKGAAQGLFMLGIAERVQDPFATCPGTGECSDIHTCTNKA